MTNKPARNNPDQVLSDGEITQPLKSGSSSMAKNQPRSRSIFMVVPTVVIVAGALVLIALFVQAVSHLGSGSETYSFPLEMSLESEGIRMEVVAATGDDYKAMAYVTLQDITGDRLSGVLALDSYWLFNAGRLHVNEAQYDEMTKTVTFRIPMIGKDLNKREFMFSLQSFWTGHQELYTTIDIPLDTIPVAKRTVWLNEDDWVDAKLTGEKGVDISNKKGLSVLPVNEMQIPIPSIESAYISNIGFIDGQLHVQLCWIKEGFAFERKDDSANIHLNNGSGEQMNSINNDISVSFRADAQGNIRKGSDRAQGLYVEAGGTAYEEFVFLADDISFPFSLQGLFVINREFITGDWNAAFRLQTVQTLKQAKGNIDIGVSKIHTIAVSPLGWTVLGKKQAETDIPIDVLEKMIDEAQNTTGDTYYIDRGTTFEFHMLAHDPIDVTQIDDVLINGQLIPLVEKP